MTTRTRCSKIDPHLAQVLCDLAHVLPPQNAPDTVRRMAVSTGYNPLVVTSAFTLHFGISPDRYRARVAVGAETIPESIAHWVERGTVVRTKSAPRHNGHSTGLK